MGNFTSRALLQRELLSVFGASYTFIAQRRHHNVKLWPSVKRELTWAAHLIHMSHRSLAAEWSPIVHCFDASWWGFGIVKKHVRKEVVRDTARRFERRRFTREHEDRWRTRHTDGDPAIRAPGETERNLKKISPCQRIKNEEEKQTTRVRVASHPPCPEDLPKI